MPKRKSQAQIRRMQKRASSRGETYEAPIVDDESRTRSEDGKAQSEDDNALNGAIQSSAGQNQEGANELPQADRQKRIEAAEKLEAELARIASDQEVKSKDRRSAKRRAEAIASEESGLAASELLEWYKENVRQRPGKRSRNELSPRKDGPLIAFFGQLSYSTTQEKLLGHILNNLKEEIPITKESIVVRMLSDAKTGKSRGMAFVEVQDPKALYALLKLHQTSLDGRRINVERSAGGKKGSETRKAKISKYREEQHQFMVETVEKIFAEFEKTGEIRDDELDDGVKKLCARHTASVVEAAVREYVEKGGRDMDNPSAYLTFLLTKFANEGIRPQDSKPAKIISK